MDICIIHPSFRIYGGAELVIVRLIQELTKRKHTVALYTQEISYEVKRELSNINIYIGSWLEIAKKIRELNYEVYNPHNDPAEMYCTKKPVVWNCNEPPHLALEGRELPKSHVEHVKNIVDKVIVADEYNAERFFKLYGINPEIIPYGIDYSFWNTKVNSSFREEYGLKDSFVILHSSWFNPFKHPEISLEIFLKLRDIIPNIKLVYTGLYHTPLGISIYNKVKESKYRDDIMFLGHVTREYLREIYQSADVVLCPFERQGGWLTPLEALSAGVIPIVSTKAPSAQYLTENNLCIVTDDYVEAILKVYNNEIDIEEIIEHSRKFIKKNLTWSKYTDRMIEVYRSVLK